MGDDGVPIFGPIDHSRSDLLNSSINIGNPIQKHQPMLRRKTHNNPASQRPLK